MLLFSSILILLLRVYTFLYFRFPWIWNDYGRKKASPLRSLYNHHRHSPYSKATQRKKRTKNKKNPEMNVNRNSCVFSAWRRIEALKEFWSGSFVVVVLMMMMEYLYEFIQISSNELIHFVARTLLSNKGDAKRMDWYLYSGICDFLILFHLTSRFQSKHLWSWEQLKNVNYVTCEIISITLAEKNSFKSSEIECVLRIVQSEGWSDADDEEVSSNSNWKLKSKMFVVALRCGLRREFSTCGIFIT